MNWKIRAKSYMQPILPTLPKTSKALFSCIVNGSEKPYRRSELIRCECCFLTVHNVCYGIHEDIKTWICDRCQSQSPIVVSNIIKRFCNLYLTI